MTKLKTFIRVFSKSVTSFSYYRDIIKVPQSFSYKYFFFFMFILSITATTLITIPLNREIPKFINRAQQYSRTLFPEDLKIEVKGGTLTINQPQPFIIPLPVELVTEEPVAISDQKRVNLFVFDEKATLDDIDTHQALILANATTVMIRSDQGEIRAYPLREMEDFTLTASMINATINTIVPYTRYIVPLIAAVLFLTLFSMLPLIKWFSIAFLSLFTMIIGRAVIGLNLSYGKYLQIGLHSMTLPLLVEIAMLWLGITKPFTGFHSLFFILYTAIILTHLKQVE